MKNKFFLCSLLLLGACNMQHSGGGEPLAQMTFEHVKKHPIYVASYEPIAFTSNTKQLASEGFVVDPANIIYDYLTSRYEASGAQGKLKIVIKDVSIEHEVVKSVHKLGELFGVDKRDHYIIQAELGLQIYGITKYEQQEITFKANRNIYISEHSSLVDREEVQMRALDSMIDDLDIAIRKVLKEKFFVL